MNITLRKPRDEEERDWAHEEDRWLNERDYPDDYVGASHCEALIAEIDGVRCVVRIEAPGFSDRFASRIAAALKV